VQLFTHIEHEWAQLRAAPVSFVMLLVLGVGAGLGIGTWYYSGRVSEKDGLIARYRVALGIDRSSQGNLIELTGEEMRAKGLNTAAALRDMCVSLRNQTESAAAGATDDADKASRSLRILKEVSDEFDRKLKADTYNVDNELRRRLGPKAVAAIVGVPPSVFSTSDRAALDVTGLTPSGTGMSAGFVCTLADSIEQMARLLPTK
jgi:hypothetical protein